MQKVKANKGQKVSTKANKGDKTMKKQTEQKQVLKLDDVIYNTLNKTMEADKNIRTQQNTGHIAVKYGNKVMFEFHAKKKSISHLTFCSQDKVFAIIKEKFTAGKAYRIVPKSYGWRIDTEILITPEVAKEFPNLLKSCIAEAVERLNLKEKAEKKAEKKVAKA